MIYRRDEFLTLHANSIWWEVIAHPFFLDFQHISVKYEYFDLKKFFIEFSGSSKFSGSTKGLNF